MQATAMSLDEGRETQEGPSVLFMPIQDKKQVYRDKPLKGCHGTPPSCPG